MTRMNAHGDCHGSSWVSRHPSADADELLLVGVVVAKDQSSRADECGVTHGAASARPQLDLLREIADDRAKFALLALCPPRSRSAPAPAPVRRRASRSRQFRAPEDRGRDTRRPGRCWRRASPRPACRSRGARRTGSQRAAGSTPLGARTAGGTSRGCSASSRTSGVHARCGPAPGASRRRPAPAPASTRPGAVRAAAGPTRAG